MKYPGTRIITKSQVTSLLQMPDLVEAMEAAFKSHATGRSLGTGLLHFDAASGLEFHIKAGGLSMDAIYMGVKVNGASFQNTERFGLPNIIGTITLFDGECGFPVAIIDSVDITILRTGATTAAAARYLARGDASAVTICGCGKQGRVQLEAIKSVLPITRAFSFDSNERATMVFAAEMAGKLGIPVEPVSDLGTATKQSDVIVTCTPSRKAYLQKDDVRPGTFIAAVGADSPAKQELDERLLQGNKIVVDILDQCARAGELHHALAKGLVEPGDVHAELGQVFAGIKPGRVAADETIIYDATGTALQDTAAAVLCFKKAVEKRIGLVVNLQG